MLTKLEDQILLSVWKFQGKAYGINVYQHLEQMTQSKVAIGVVYFTLDRLAKRGYLESYKGEPTAIRGGMRKKYYKITQKGIDALTTSKKVNDRIWSEFPGSVKERT
ncbi:MAG: helix-turn-helix transcriptional regulator [Candidatus Aminicenantaceae bacterium]|jgi:PadR family transcriptional regulator PadR